MNRKFIVVFAVCLTFVLAGLLLSAGYSTSNYTEQGGARTVVGGSLDVVSGGDLDIESGGKLTFKTYSEYNTATVDLTNAQIKAMRATPVELVPAQGAGTVIEFVGAVLILDYGSNALTESTDNMAVEYNDGTAATASEAIESGSFIDATADTITNAVPVKDVVDASADIVNKNLALANTGDGEFAGNAGNDTVMRVVTTYRVHSSLGL